MAIGLTPKYEREIGLNGLTNEQFIALAEETVKKLGWKVVLASERGLIAQTQNSGLYFPSNDYLVTIQLEIEYAQVRSECQGGELVDWGKNKKNVESFEATLKEWKDAFSAEQLETRYSELKQGFVAGNEDLLIKAPSTAGEKVAGVLSFFKPTNGYFITPILILLNILVFIIMAISGVDIFKPSGESLVAWGANFRPITLAGEWWRLLTCCFLHIGILHLLLNMYALMYIGLLLEPYLGKLRFSAAYLLAGISASLTSLGWHDLTISAGASGAIFGMYGVFLAMLTTNLIEKSARKELLMSIVVFVGYNLVFGLKGGIDNAAHIGGLVSGMVIGYAYLPSLKNPASPKLVNGAIALLAVVVLGLTVVGFKTISNDFGIYEERIKTFVPLEKQALRVYYLPENAPREVYMAAIQNDGIPNWMESRKLILELDSLDLPDSFHRRNELLLSYIDLRIKSYQLMYRTAAEDTDRYSDSLTYYNNEIESIFEQLKTE